MNILDYIPNGKDNAIKKFEDFLDVCKSGNVRERGVVWQREKL